MKSTSAPRIFIYNPTCEIAIANGSLSFMPNKTLSKFESDLDVLPMYFTDKNDVLLVRQLPDQKFLDLLLNAGVSLPKFKLLESALQDQDFLRQPKQSLQAWGWSPRIHHIFKPLKQSCSPDFLNQPNAYWKTEHRNLYGRKTALEVLKSFLNKTQNHNYVDQSKIARICTSVSEIEELIREWKQLVIKAPLSSSGRGLQVLRQSHLNDSITQWINGTLKFQGYVTVEALLNKQFDFSLQFYCDGKGNLEYLGPGFFETNSNGQYEGNILGSMPEALQFYLSGSQMAELSSGVSEAITESEISTNYCGYLGIDCMLFTDNLGNMNIQPCVEINMRYNMGTLAIFLDKYLHQDSKGSFKMLFKPKSSFDIFHKEMTKKYPFEMKNGKWSKGYLPLVSPFQNKSFGAYILLETIDRQNKPIHLL